MSPQTISAQCCIAGGGPAGIMLGLLLARAGVSVVVLEKHKDFLRDFRGDTIHPSTLEVMYELGFIDDLLKLPHQKARHISGWIGGTEIRVADFSHLRVHCPFIAMMPQWDFLTFLAGKAKAYPGFRLMMETPALSLLQEEGRVTGVRAQGADGPLDIHAALTVAADGRHSTLRGEAGFISDDLGAPIDVLWFRVERAPGDPDETSARFDAGRIMVLIDRADYWQCAYVIAKGSGEALRARGIEAFRAEVAAVSPFSAERLAALKDFGAVSQLSVAVDRLRTWHMPGMLCIGDAAHAMSPIGGVGINFAVQDAVAAANLLAGPLRAGAVSDADLARVQRRREWPVAVTQRIQVAIQNNVIGPALAATAPLSAPWPVRLLKRLPMLQRIPGRLIGMGLRPEHVAPL